jgi:iron complex outermembrane recepter protein
MSIDATIRRVSVVVCVAGALSGSFVATRAAHAADSTTATGDSTEDAKSAPPTLMEVIVTAQKREERLQDVPIPVTALSGDTLAENNQTKIEDFYTKIPGLSISPGVFTFQNISIRGISTGSTTSASTVGIMVDDVPYGSAQHLFIPDIDPGDLARIEVLRGPQGTLYGASSMGGLIKFVTTEPSSSGVSGRLEAGTDTVYNGAQPGYSFRGSVNLPLNDVLAVRVSGFTRLDPGYIDNPVTGQNGINEDRANGGHIALLWHPSGDLSLNLSALYQQTRGTGTSDSNLDTNGYVGPPLSGHLQQNYVPGVGPYEREAQAYSAVFKDKIGAVDLVSVTGYNVYAVRDSFDDTNALGSLTQFGVPGTAFTGFGVPGTPIFDFQKTSKLSEELRLSSSIGPHFDWLLGGFYTHEFSPASQTVLAENPTTGAIAGQFLYTPFPSTYQEYAAFADLTYHITDRFDVQVGGRESKIHQTFNETYFGVYDVCCTPTGVSPYTQPPENAKSSPFTYLLTPRLRLSNDLMLYARAASGYRPGGPNAAGLGVPAAYQPDKTKDYEVGAKGDLLDHEISFDASVYYIDWKNIQLGLTNPSTGIEYTGNASAAKSEGVELSTEIHPVTGLTIAAWVDYTDAELTEPLPYAPPGSGLPYGPAGSRLPDSARWTGNVSLDQDFRLPGKVMGFAGGSLSYVGARQDVFTATPEREYLPPYARLDLRGGVKYDLWTVNLYVNNVTNRDGLISGGLGNGVPYSFWYIQPRTVGLSLVRTF